MGRGPRSFAGMTPGLPLRSFHSMLGIYSAEWSGGSAWTTAMSELVKGIIHVHSDFSRDGLCSIADLADFAREAGFQFVGLTDHAEDLSPEDMESLRRECEKHSERSFVMIPGLEFRCSDDIHILGLGITGDISSSDAVTLT